MRVERASGGERRATAVASLEANRSRLSWDYLQFAGSGAGNGLSCEAALRDFVTNNDLKHSVGFAGYVTNVHEYLQASDIFVLLSESEGMALALLEALACGLPAVAKEVGGMVNIRVDGRNGLLVAPGDSELLSDASRCLIDDKTTADSLGDSGRSTVQERFPIDAVVAGYLTLFLSAQRDNEHSAG